MDSPDKVEQLFLLEVLIDKVVLKDLPPETPIRLRVKFIEFPCFEITQQDFKKDEQPESNGTNFNSGKSFLFPMVPIELIRNLQRHPLAVTVFQIKEDAPLLPEIVGQTRVRMSEGMSEAVFAAMSCNCDHELPISHTLTDTFSLRNMGEEVGTIALFIRLSCFGQSIVTQFQLMGEKKAFLFKNSKADNSFQCKKPKERPETEEPTKYDVLPVAPFLTSEDNVFDLYSPTGDAEDTTVAWKVTPPKPAPCPVCETRPGCNPDKKTTCPPKPKPCPHKPPKPPCNKCRSNQSSRPTQPTPASPKKPCNICGATKPTPPSPKNPCNICGATKPTPPSPKNPCNSCGTTKPTPPKTPCYACGMIPPSPQHSATQSPANPALPVNDDDVSTCGTALGFKDSDDSSQKEPPFVCPFCGTTVPPNKETKVCSVCGTSRPPDKQTKTCSVCGTGCPFLEKPQECSICGYACPGNDNFAPPAKSPTCPECGEEVPTAICPTPCTCPCEDEEDDVELPQPNPPVRYDTTGALSPAFMGSGSSGDCTCAEPSEPPSPPLSVPVRYDTTGALSPAFAGWGSSGDDDCTCEEPSEPPNPPVRYDTTGALSPAFMGWPEKPPEPLPPSPYCQCGGMEAGDAPAAATESSPRNSIGQGQGQGDGVEPPNAGFFATKPVWQTGSTPDVMERQGSGGLAGEMKTKSKSDERIAKSPYEQTGGDTQMKRKKRRTKWTRKWGLQYPGIKFGHRHCVESSRQVPPHMGWLWNNPSVGHKYKKGWRPGAVGYTISKMINEHREATGRPPLGTNAKSKWKSGRGGFGGGPSGPQPPTLHIHRREGAYYISMHPLDLGPDAVNVPLQFKIPKREREEGDEDSSSSSEESELEIEFMAPGAFELKQPPPEFKSFGTQYLDEDHTPKEKELPALQVGKKGKKGGSAKGGKGGKKGKVTITSAPVVHPLVLEMFKSVTKSASGRKPTGFVRAPPPPEDDDDDDGDEPAKGVVWDADPTTAVGKGRLKFS